MQQHPDPPSLHNSLRRTLAKLRRRTLDTLDSTAATAPCTAPLSDFATAPCTARAALDSTLLSAQLEQEAEKFAAEGPTYAVAKFEAKVFRF